MALNEETKTSIYGSKSLDLVAGDVVKIQKNGVDDPDMTYTVPSAKKITMGVRFSGELQDA